LNEVSEEAACLRSFALG